MEYETILFTKRGQIGFLTLNRPERRNGLNNQMFKDLKACFDALCEELDTRVVILRGAGENFSAGHDLDTIAEDMNEETMGRSQANYHGVRLATDVILSLRRAPQPVIAAVQGPAVGGAFSLALACDIRIAAESARFYQGAVLIGGPGGDMSSSYFLPRLIGLSNAAEFLYTGEKIDAATAYRIGLVSRVVPDEELENTAVAMAEKMLRVSPLGLRMTKELLDINSGPVTLEQAIHMENRSGVMCAMTEDFEEGPRAFLEKRRPVWKDR